MKSLGWWVFPGRVPVSHTHWEWIYVCKCMCMYVCIYFFKYIFFVGTSCNPFQLLTFDPWCHHCHVQQLRISCIILSFDWESCRWWLTVSDGHKKKNNILATCGFQLALDLYFSCHFESLQGAYILLGNSQMTQAKIIYSTINCQLW